MNEQPLLSGRGLTKHYGAQIGCVDVSFDLYRGEVLGIVGESGSGKSTLLSCLCRASDPRWGAVPGPACPRMPSTAVAIWCCRV